MNRFLALFLVPVFFLGCCMSNRSVVTITTSSGSKLAVSVELADTPEERAQGLMFRTELADGHGMLFLFPSEAQESFWMKNTPIPLDMIFIKDNRVVDLIENAVPYSETLLSPDSSYDMVLEVPGGTVARNGIATGDSMDYH